MDNNEQQWWISTNPYLTVLLHAHRGREGGGTSPPSSLWEYCGQTSLRSSDGPPSRAPLMSLLESVLVSDSEESTGGLYALILLSVLPLSYWLFHRKGEWQELSLQTLQTLQTLQLLTEMDSRQFAQFYSDSCWIVMRICEFSEKAFYHFYYLCFPATFFQGMVRINFTFFLDESITVTSTLYWKIDATVVISKSLW